MNSFFQSFTGYFVYAGLLFRRGQRAASRWLRAILVIVVLQFLMVVACSTLPYHTATTWVAIVALIPFMALVLIAYAHPLIVSALAVITTKTEIGQDFFKPLYGILAYEVALGIYFACVPLSRDTGLIPLVILLWVAVLFFKGFMRFMAICGLLIVIPIFIYGGRDATWTKVDAAMSGPANGWTPGDASNKPPAARRMENDVPPATTSETKAPALPAGSSNNQMAKASGPPPPPCGVKQNETSSPIAPSYHYGDFEMTILHCHRSGSQVIISGTISYHGPDKFILYFHRFTVTDNAGIPYDVQSGALGGVNDFGKGYASLWMHPGGTVEFAFTVGSHDNSTISAPSLSVVMPYNERMGGEINFQNLVLN